MKKAKINIFLLFLSIVIFTCCSSSRKQIKDSSEKKDIAINNETSSTGVENNKELWKEANKYRATLTDSVFLKTRGYMMSYDAIDALNTKGWNYDYAYNQVVYLEALTRAKKKLSVKNDSLVLNLTSGKEINISEDLFQFIVMVVDSWNTWIGEGRFKIIKTTEGYYDIEPISNKNEPSMYSNGYILNRQKEIIGYYSNGYILDKERKIQGYYSNGYILDSNRKVIGSYANGFITLKDKK